MRMAGFEEQVGPVSKALGAAPKHPRCVSCAVSMWLVKVEHTTQGDMRLYECKACDAKVEVGPLSSAA